jgi:hypothetical protein
MGTASKTIQHDWLAVRASFPDRTKANITWSRGGETVSTVPETSPLAHTLSAIVAQSKSRMKEPGYPFKNLGEMATAIEAAAKDAKSLENYVTKLKDVLQVSGEAPRATVTGPTAPITQARFTRSRGILVEAEFASGEKVKLKINALSVSIQLTPELSSVSSAIMKLIFAVRNIGLMDDEALAQTCVDAAKLSTSSLEWLNQLRATLTPKG